MLRVNWLPLLGGKGFSDERNGHPFRLMKILFVFCILEVCYCYYNVYVPGYFPSEMQAEYAKPIMNPFLFSMVGKEPIIPLPPLYEKEDAAFGSDPCTLKPEIMSEETTVLTSMQIRECSSVPIDCTDAANSRYRTIDGSCNNLKNPTWGKADNCLRRILPFDYADKISLPRQSCTGKPLPNPRHISNVFHKESRQKRDKHTTHFMEWGQLLAHDLTLIDVFRTAESGNNFPIECCTLGPKTTSECMSIPVPPDDPFYTQFGLTCLSIPRTVPCSRCSGGQRVHSNMNTAYHDLSLVYGSNQETADLLRTYEQGMLVYEWNPLSGPTLPTVNVEELCVSPANTASCYKAGDKRSNQNPFLLTAHTYLLRHHNFICQELFKVNPQWNDERLYQEGRRINIAIAQHITFKNYLHHVLGEVMQKTGLYVLPGAQYTEYDPDLDASIADEYSAWAARYGHSLIPGNITQIDPVSKIWKTINLRDFYYMPFGFRYGQFDAMAEGMTVDLKMKHDVYFSDDVRNFLDRRTYLNEIFGMDLAAKTIARGRDHGIPSYTHYLNYFFNITVHSFDDLRKLIPDTSVNLLKQLYESVHDVDVFSAGMAERNVPGAFVGPTFSMVLGQQYRRTKFGDRYYFEHGNQAGSFTPEQLEEIKRSTLGRVLCETTKITEIQKNPFKPPAPDNPVVPCEDLHRFNFLLWKE